MDIVHFICPVPNIILPYTVSKLSQGIEKQKLFNLSSTEESQTQNTPLLFLFSYAAGVTNLIEM